MTLYKQIGNTRIPMTPEEEVEFEASRADPPAAKVLALKKEAFRNLRACDWTQLPDSLTGPDKAQWMQYRANLRQIINNPDIPVDTVLPTPPGSFTEFTP